MGGESALLGFLLGAIMKAILVLVAFVAVAYAVTASFGSAVATTGTDVIKAHQAAIDAQ
jgi:hypothetical protein